MFNVKVPKFLLMMSRRSSAVPTTVGITLSQRNSSNLSGAHPSCRREVPQSFIGVQTEMIQCDHKTNISGGTSCHRRSSESIVNDVLPTAPTANSTTLSWGFALPPWRRESTLKEATTAVASEYREVSFVSHSKLMVVELPPEEERWYSSDDYSSSQSCLKTIERLACLGNDFTWKDSAQDWNISSLLIVIMQWRRSRIILIRFFRDKVRVVGRNCKGCVWVLCGQGWEPIRWLPRTICLVVE